MKNLVALTVFSLVSNFCLAAVNSDQVGHLSVSKALVVISKPAKTKDTLIVDGESFPILKPTTLFYYKSISLSKSLDLQPTDKKSVIQDFLAKIAKNELCPKAFDGFDIAVGNKSDLDELTDKWFGSENSNEKLKSVEGLETDKSRTPETVMIAFSIIAEKQNMIGSLLFSCAELKDK
ncbi:MAG: hypothetical protein JWQ35_2475 [Bacteriovoracaceae bacterium]|nr:hypothetical protein [Bacteriovoracaceae bacterium]